MEETVGWMRFLVDFVYGLSVGVIAKSNEDYNSQSNE